MAYFSFLVLTPTGLAESASSTTPVLKLLLERALRLPQAKEMERLTAYLAENKLERWRETAGGGGQREKEEYCSNKGLWFKWSQTNDSAFSVHM